MASMTENPVVGGVTTSSAKVAVRTDAAADVTIEYATNAQFNSSTETSAVTTASAGDFTAIVPLTGLNTDDRYWYRVKVDDVIQSIAGGVVLRFDTLPASGEFVVCVFADVANQDRGANCYSNAASNDSPLFSMQIGDLDHGDPSSLADMRTMHRNARDDALDHGDDFRRHCAKRGMEHIWDDHDYGIQDGDRTFSGRANAWQAFKEYWPTHDLANAANGLWRSFTCADAEFFILDTRSQRDVNSDTDNANKSMLDGDLIADDQKEWLKNGLRDSTKKWKVIISSVTFNTDARQNSDDPWHSFSTEAQELKDWLTDESIADVVVISADLHTGGGVDDGTNSLLGVPEMTVPHTNLAGGNNVNRGTWSEGSSQGNPSSGTGKGYGKLTVNATSLTLEAKHQNGTTVRHSLTL